jgi:LmbE family N-acetylglucosaminyl deacetylase
MPEPLDLMTILAHPDDESFGMGGTLCRYADTGLRVGCVCATRGEAGEISDPALASPETLAQVREHELVEACRIAGTAIPPIFLGHRDSGMAGTVENQNPRALINQPDSKVVTQLVGLLRTWRPRVVATFEPGGGYGHPDHIAVSRQTMAAIEAAAQPADRPELGLPHRPARVFQSARRIGEWAEIVKEARSRGIDIHVPAGPDPSLRGVPPEQIGAAIKIDLERKQATWRAHPTQLNSDSIFLKLPPDLASRAFEVEYYIQAYPPRQPGDPVLDDLFAGLATAAV